MFKVIGIDVLVSLLSLLATAQPSPEVMQQPTGSVPTVRLENASAREVPRVTVDLLTVPILCAADGTSFVQLARETGLDDVLAISRDGSQVVQFSRSKINDIGEPVPRNFGVGGSDLYVLVNGRIPEDKVLTFKKPNGETFQQQAARSVEYVARFNKDGSYLGAIRLDIPFEPLQIGIFADADFLIAGYDKATFEPRIALVKSTGQFQRFVDLPGDLHRSDDRQVNTDATDEKTADVTALPKFGQSVDHNLWGALNLSMIIADGRNLLLIRPGYKVPVFSVSAGGEVTTVELEMPAAYSLTDLKVGNGRWIGIYTQKREDGNGLQIETVAHDPMTGKMVARYALPSALGLAAGCVSQGQISFLTTKDNKLVLNMLSVPTTTPNMEIPVSNRPAK